MNHRKSSPQSSSSGGHRDAPHCQSDYHVSLTLGVGNVGVLWAAAAAKALSMPDMTLEDVLDLLGPREDPEIAECLAMLTAPVAVPGCTLGDFSVERIASTAPIFAEARRPAGRRPAPAPFAGSLAQNAVSGARRAAALGICEADFGDAARRMAPVPKSRLN